ncbi:LysR family transcriptional regulator [Brevibacillus daliensis]|uniref:LysR family transcriptional regulator n=1 Tax=Brevibacillus daliensis TaxID=2892995 RepID=UPI001E3F571E|nr:LysR family transcriptional regulator [Brevibacillus daliensis]
MDIKLLQTFQVAATCENFNQTAEMLYIAQPTVTQHIRQLEREIGVELFERVGKRVKLTTAGQRFLNHAQMILANWNAGLEDMVAWKQGYKETLQIAVSPIIARTSLPSLIHRYTAENPEVDITIKIADSINIGAMVQSGQADLGLSRMIPAEWQLSAYLMQTDPIVFAVPHYGGDMESPLPDWEQELTSKRLLTHNHPVYWEPLLANLRQRGFEIHTMVVTHVDITKRFIEEGLGISFLPRSSIRRELFENRFMELPTPGLDLPKVASYLITPEQPVTGPRERFVEILASLYAPLPKVQ